MKRIGRKFVLPVFIAVVLAGFAAVSFLQAQEDGSFSVDVVQIRTQGGEQHFFKIELANTDETRATGLMNRKSMNDDAGMLFIFDDIAIRRFWMKNTLIPLDILFISPNGVINHIHSNATPLDTSLISSPTPSAAVFEINGGMAAKLGLTVGDKVYHPALHNMVLQ